MASNSKPSAFVEDDWVMDSARRHAQDQQSPSQPPRSKAERFAEHKESNRKIWQAAEEDPDPVPYHVAATPTVPFAQSFTQPKMILSRKPVAKTIDPITGMKKLTIEDDEDEGAGANDQKPTAAELEEQRKREREAKERAYEERKAKLYSNTTPESTSGTSTPARTTTPPLREGAVSRGNGRGGRGNRGRGGRGRGQQRGGGGGESYRSDVRTDSQERRSMSSNAGTRELFDPDASSKSSPRPLRGVGTGSGTGSPTPRAQESFRPPRGPDASGGSGFAGFANRGGKIG